MRLHQILKALEELRPASRATSQLCMEGDHLLMRVLKSGGVRAVAGLVARLNAKGRRFEVEQNGGHYCYWREALGARAFQIRVLAHRDFKMAGLRYIAVARVKPLTPAEQRRDAQQKQFYDRYMEIGQRAYKGGRITAPERTLLLVGELEADVNNGGFSQYLSNKGRRRARDAVRALEAIGAGKTARLLEKALAPRVSEETLNALDERFYTVPEDLALLGARYLTAAKG